MARPIDASAAATVSTDQREDLTDEIAEEGRERDQIDVDREQHQLDRHQDDDDVLAVDEDAEDADREQDRGDRQVMRQADGHRDPPPRLDLAHFDGSGRRARDLGGDRLPLDVGLVAQRQHDGADHGDQQHHARRLEEEDVSGVEHRAERGGVGDIRSGNGRR